MPFFTVKSQSIFASTPLSLNAGAHLSLGVRFTGAHKRLYRFYRSHERLSRLYKYL